jgi:hypothetical protein
VLRDLDSGAEIAHHTARLLREAGVDGRLPTPVEDIIAAADLVEPAESLLSDDAIADAPGHLKRAMAKLRHKVEALLDRKAKEIHLDPTIHHEGQRRFKQLHEVSHKILPWQEDSAYADDRKTLSWTTQRLFEQEANQGSAELLFQRDLFAAMAADYETGFASIVELHKLFRASIHASFRRYVETHKQPMAGVVLRSKPCQLEPIGYRRQEAVNSESWTELYGPVAAWPTTLSTPFSFVDRVAGLETNQIRRCSFTCPDLNNEMTALNVELFSNFYRVFVLLWPPRRERFKRRRILVSSEAR